MPRDICRRRRIGLKTAPDGAGLIAILSQWTIGHTPFPACNTPHQPTLLSPYAPIFRCRLTTRCITKINRFTAEIIISPYEKCSIAAVLQNQRLLFV